MRLVEALVVRSQKQAIVVESSGADQESDTSGHGGAEAPTEPKKASATQEKAGGASPKKSSFEQESTDVHTGGESSVRADEKAVTALSLAPEKLEERRDAQLFASNSTQGQALVEMYEAALDRTYARKGGADPTPEPTPKPTPKPTSNPAPKEEDMPYTEQDGSAARARSQCSASATCVYVATGPDG